MEFSSRKSFQYWCREYSISVEAFWNTLCNLSESEYLQDRIERKRKKEWERKDVSSFSPACPLSRFRSSVNTRGNSNSRQALRRVLSPPAFALLPPLLPLATSKVVSSHVWLSCLLVAVDPRSRWIRAKGRSFGGSLFFKCHPKFWTHVFHKFLSLQLTRNTVILFSRK